MTVTLSPRPDLTTEDFRQGAAILSLIEDWGSWAHRRVEQVTLADLQASARRVSLDFTLAPDPSTPPLSSNSTDYGYLVPVTFITKHRITRFSLRGESDSALSAWTQTQTAIITTAMLAEAAADIVQPPTQIPRSIRQPRSLTQPLRPRYASIPPDLLDDFWIIALAKRQEALEKWQHLHLCSSNDKVSAKNREESLQWRQAITGADDFMALANDVARNFLILTPLVGQQGTRRIIKLSYEEQRLSTPVKKKGQQDTESGSFEPRSLPNSNFGAYLWELQRFFGLRAKNIEIPATGIGLAQCYHLEVDVPDGLNLTRAKLLAYPASENQTHKDGVSGVSTPETTVAKSSPPKRRDTIIRTSQRAHLHLADVSSAFTGVGLISLRIRDELVLRGAWINGAFTVILISFVATFSNIFQRNPDAAIAILLGIPGGVSLYLARPQEPGMSAAMHAGVRLLALGNAIVAFSAVAVVLAGGDCHTNPKTGDEVCKSWSGMEPSLMALAALAGIMLAILSIGYYLLRHPPEQWSNKHKSNEPQENVGFG